jgi:TonB-dependent SusC/RagA subfamily outer membrane receptor
MRCLFIFALSFGFATMQAQPQQQKWNRQMQLINCAISIKAGPATATSYIEMEFYNPNDQELEGLHQFKLNPGQVITAFQLDLNGKYRDGTIEEKWKATNAYNRIVGKRIDPALLTMDNKNQYSLRIYPVPARASRKITFTIEQLLTIGKGFLHYSLPFNLRDTVKKVTICIRSAGRNEMPLADPGLIAGQKFSKASEHYQLAFEAGNLLLNAPISFSIRFPQQALLCGSNQDRQNNFAVLFRPGPGTSPKINSQQLTIFWDASASAKARDLNKELMFLQQFLSVNAVEKITLIPFSYRLLDTLFFYPAKGGISGLKQYLRNTVYDGPTQLGCIRIEKNRRDLFMLFTDGNNTYGDQTPATNGCLIFCINSFPAAELKALEKIVGTGGGKVINLKSASVNEAITSSMTAEIWLKELRSASGKIIINQQLPLRLEPSMLFTGTFEDTMDSLFFFYGNRDVITVKKEAMNFSSLCCGETASARLSMLQQFEKVISSNDWEQVLDFGIHEKVVTPNTAYIVLERIEDYIRYNIEAPEELKAECELLQYVRSDTRTLRQKIRQKDEFNILKNVVDVYNRRLQKMDNSLTGIILHREDIEGQENIRESAENSGVTTRSELATTNAVSGTSPIVGQSNGLQDVVVVAYSPMQKKSMTGSVTYIRSNELNGAGTVEQALQGRVPGVTVTQNSLVPGSQHKITMRGISSLSGNVSPLFILDDMPVTGDINDLINVSEISNITVLRDVQAAALYGSRAANGAVIIQTKRSRNYTYRDRRRYRLKDMEDVGYMQGLKEVPVNEQWEAYSKLRQEHGAETGFYFDVAEHFFMHGMKKKAFEILINAAEVGRGGEAVQHAIAYVLESWKMYREAINIYQHLVESNYQDLSLHRDLAWVYYQDGQYQAAVDILYDAIIIDPKPAGADNPELKATMLYEMNQIISMHGNNINTTRIPSALIKTYPSELRIVLDCNRSNLSPMKVIEPGGKVVTENKNSASASAFIYGSADYHYGGNRTVVYQAQKAKPGKYRVLVNFYGYSYPGDAPSFIRIKTFKHFGKPNQSVEIENVIMDNQYGEVEIASLEFDPFKK